MTIPLALFVPLLVAQAPTPVELGRVAWRRDHDAAFAASRQGGKPVLLFFQEVPG